MGVTQKAVLICAGWLLLDAASLHAHPPERVDLAGDPLPAQAIGRLGTDRFVTRNSITSMAFSFDGALLAAADYHGGYLWDAKTGARLLHITDGGGRVAISTDGHWLACGSIDPVLSRPIRVWDVRTKKATDFRFPKGAAAFGFSPDGKTLGVTFEKTTDVYLYDVPTWKLRVKLAGPEAAQCHDLAFSQDGRLLAVGHTAARAAIDNGNKWMKPTGVVSLYELDKKERKREFLASHVDVKNLAFTIEQKGLFAMSEGRANGWDIDTGKTTPWTGEFWFNGVSLDSAGKTLAVPRQMMVVDFTTKKLIHAFGKENESAASMTLSGNGKKVAAVCYGGAKAAPIIVWDIDTRKPYPRGAGHLGPVNAIAYSNDGKRIVTSSTADGTFALWDAASAKQLSTTPFKDPKATPNVQWVGPHNVAFYGDGGTLFLSGQHWDLAKGKPVRRLLPADAPRDLVEATGANLSPNGKWAVRFVPILPTTGEITRFRNVFSQVNPPKSLLDLQDAKKGAGDQVEEFLQFWAFANHGPLACVQRRHTNGPVTVIAEKNRLEVWDIVAQKRIHSLARGDENLRAVAFSPDDRRLAIFASYQPRLDLVDLRLERKLWRKTWQEDDFNHTWRDLAFAPHGHWIAAMSESRSIQLLETWTGQEVASFQGHLRPINALTFSPDGRHFASASEDTTALVWSALPADPPLPERWKDDDYLWKELASSTASAYRVVGPLIAHPKRAIQLFEKRLGPAPPIDTKAIQKDLNNLGSASFAERESAMKRLRALGSHVLPALREALKEPSSLEVKRRLEDLNETTVFSFSPDELRSLRAILVLELAKMPEAVPFLRRLAQGDPVAEPTLQARAALERLETLAKNR